MCCDCLPGLVQLDHRSYSLKAGRQVLGVQSANLLGFCCIDLAIF